MELSKMRAWKAKRALGIAAVGMSSFGCQIVGGLPSELKLDDDPGSLPPRDPLVWEATEPGSEMIYTMPEWLEYLNRSDTPRTSQVGPNTLRIGYQKNEPRPRNVGTGWGLAMETERTNLNPRSRWGGAGWTTPAESMLVVPDAPDPAGGMDGVSLISSGTQSSPWIGVDGTIASAWVVGAQGEGTFAYLAYGNAFVTVGDTAWKRYEVRTSEEMPLLRLTTEAIGAAPAITLQTSVHVYGAQVEVGTYPSSFIPTTGAPVLREADLLNVDMETLAPSGYFDVTIRYAPHFAQNEQVVDHDIVALEDDSTFFRMKAGGTLALLKVGSPDSLRIEGLDWARDQELEVRVQYLPNRRLISIKGATKGDATVSKLGPVEPVGKDSTVWLLGDNDGPQESVDLRYIEIR
ncbi:phage head spike fiber domain-containing protein [Polyangium jinanense]|uniref:Uncharacterized protein n=1 Tax=Polyangium jinanense TaxID=2829994 RepID=A0A9X4ARP5_9BACT|nr:hypothetical protein [Polyangium jinanense]MDC3952666.1 hypothetical protein [Polyangium jinanense]MDC3980285.1 hypothetical protein [Polyangium jinanense]